MSYWLMDGRALHSIDDAIVLETCGTIQEARQNLSDYGMDTCIVDVKEQKVIDCLLWHNDPLWDDNLYAED